MLRVEFVVEYADGRTTMDVWRSGGDGAPELLFSLSRGYEVPADAIGWCARVALLCALNPWALSDNVGAAYEELEARC